MSSTSNNFQLFPKPNRELVTARSASVAWLGVTPSSTATLNRILEDNHERWHIYYSDRGFHNHTAHMALALWSMGANESVLEAAYKADSSIQRPAYASPGAIDHNNWEEHLGDQNYYRAYLAFFTENIKVKGSAAILEEYVFSADANIAKGHPDMVSRFVDGILHPLIHTGYGFEFGLPGIVAEGLAMTAVHRTKSPKTIPSSMFESENKGNLSEVSSKNRVSAGFKDAPKPPVHALTIVARILADPRFADIESNQFAVAIYQDTHDKHGDAIKEYVDQWTLDGSIEKKVEELIWAVTVIYGVGGHEDGRLNADFILMHLVTSSMFLPSLINQLRRSSQEILLRSYLATTLVWYVGRGRPRIDVNAFYEKTTASPIIPGAELPPTPAFEHVSTPNPWFPILQSTLAHPDDHLVKLQRALFYFAGVYGFSIAGDLEDIELIGAKNLDGSLFIRAAILSSERLGWVREGGKLGEWDWVGFYNTPGDNVHSWHESYSVRN